MFIYLWTNHGSDTMVKQVSKTPDDADIVNIPDLVDEIQFLNQASSMYMS